MVVSKKGKYSRTGGMIVDTSTLYGPGRTHVPVSVRNILGVEKGDKLVWVVDGDKIYVESANK